MTEFDSFIEECIPGVCDGVRNGRVNIKDCGKTIIDTSLDVYPDAVIISAYGSLISGKFKEYSDIDVLVFSKYGAKWEKKCIVKDGYAIEINKVNIFYLKDVFSFSCSIRLCVLMQAVIEGEIFYGDSRVYEKIKILAKNYMNLGPSTVESMEIDTIRANLTSKLIDIKSSEDVNLSISLGMSIYYKIITLILLYEKQWLGYDKKIEETLNSCSSKFKMNDIANAYKNLFSGEKDLLVDLIIGVLYECGGPYWNGYSRIFLK